MGLGGIQMTTQMAFDPDTLDVLRKALEGAWARLSFGQQALVSKAAFAERILNAAAAGERDPVKLQEYALGAHLSWNRPGGAVAILVPPADRNLARRSHAN
jgi:hypothetical protein